MARIDRKRQEIRIPFVGFDIEPLHEIGAHIGAPRIFRVVELDVIGARIWDWHLPRPDFVVLGVIHRKTVGMELGEPQPVL